MTEKKKASKKTDKPQQQEKKVEKKKMKEEEKATEKVKDTKGKGKMDEKGAGGGQRSSTKKNEMAEDKDCPPAPESPSAALLGHRCSTKINNEQE
jgi:hypothetical protein